MISQYSPSNVGVNGPPSFVNDKVPSLLIERTIKPNVSTCALSPRVIVESSPSTLTIKFPLGVVIVWYPTSSIDSLKKSIACLV